MNVQQELKLELSKKQRSISLSAFDGRGEGALKNLLDTNFLEYASYVIKDRAIPNLEDGLKPVQRRILYALHERDDGKFIKVANIVGHTMQYHPHGDASIADALVTLTNKRYLIEGQGNFGNIYTGDPPAASRYIECRLTELARTQLFNKHLTTFINSYDGRNREPVLLPCKIPLLLMLGAEGIAVGLATRILPHNFIELLEGMIAVLQKKTIPELLPDFQQGGLMDATEYNKGIGKVKVRAVIEKKDKASLVIRELPFGTTTDSLINSVESAIRKKKLKIHAINDFTAEKVEIQISLSPGEDQERSIQALYALTDCQVSVSSNLLAIKDNRPVQLNVDEVVKFYAHSLKLLLERELEWEKNRLLESFHHKTLVQLFVENRLYKHIEECKTYETVQKAVRNGVNKFRSQLKRDVTPEDVEMLLSIPIKKISRFDIERNKKEIGEVLESLNEVEKNLKNLTRYAVRYLKNLIKKYQEIYPRRTLLTSFEQIEVRAVTSTECNMQYDKASGYFGYSVKGESLFSCSSLDKLIMVWKDGRYKVILPEAKIFVGKDIVYCKVYDRDKIMTVVYTAGPQIYLKKFTFGGVIMNKEYRLAPLKSRILLYEDTQPEKIYVKYKPSKNQRLHQQIFPTGKFIVKSVKARGNQVSKKKIATVGIRKPRNWDENSGEDLNAELLDL